MSVNILTVKELKALLKRYPDTMNVVILRDEDYAVTRGKEYDGIEYHEVVPMTESWDVYKISKVKGEGKQVLLLSSTPIELSADSTE